MRRFSSIGAGSLVVAIGVLHTVFGLALGAAPLAGIAADGYVGAVEESFDRMAIFWVLAFGFALILAGESFRAIERRGDGVPRRLGWMLAAISLAGAAAIPASGFWLGLVPAALVLARPRAASGLSARSRTAGGAPTRR